jgi:5,10-methylenetetrahydrofolate reductase
MANYLNKNIPGISIPEEMIKRLLKSSDRGRTSVELASELIAELKELCQGINVVPIGWESKVPALLDLLKM